MALLGDAAHAMLPHLGQGANQTIEDAVVLARVLASSSSETVEGALRFYEERRMARTKQVQDAARQMNTFLHIGPGPAWDERSMAFPRFYETFSWLQGYDVYDDLETPT